MKLSDVGIKYSSKANKIVNGYEVRWSEWPWLVSLRHYQESSYHMCGGAMFEPGFIVTAAHCLGSSGYVALPGSMHVPSVMPFLDEKAHPSADIAVVRVGTDFDLGWDEMAQLNRNPNLPADREVCLVAGRGLLDSDDTSASHPDLHEAAVGQVPFDVCDRYMDGRIDDDRDICAGYRGVDSCNGDSGGPLADVWRETVYGVVSRGIPPCGSNPSIYTRVSTYVDWIYEVMDEMSDSESESELTD